MLCGLGFCVSSYGEGPGRGKMIDGGLLVSMAHGKAIMADGKLEIAAEKIRRV